MKKEIVRLTINCHLQKVNNSKSSIQVFLIRTSKTFQEESQNLLMSKKLLKEKRKKRGLAQRKRKLLSLEEVEIDL